VSIFSAIQSAFTPAGTNAVRSANDQKNAYSGLASQIGQAQGHFFSALQPTLNQGLWSASQALTPGGVQAAIEAHRRMLMSQAQQAFPGMQAALMDGGAGIGAIQGAHYHLLNDALRQGNDFASYYASPEGQQAIAQALGVISGQALNPFYGNAGIVGGYSPTIVGGTGLGPLLGQGAQIWSAMRGGH
jgi:hypothetical protein